MKDTYCFEIACQLKESQNFEIKKMHYLADSLKFILEDQIDKRQYDVTIKPRETNVVPKAAKLFCIVKDTKTCMKHYLYRDKDYRIYCDCNDFIEEGVCDHINHLEDSGIDVPEVII